MRYSLPFYKLHAMKATALFLVVNYLLAAVLAAYPPVAPIQGSYTWEIVISDEKGPEAYTGGTLPLLSRLRLLPHSYLSLSFA